MLYIEYVSRRPGVTIEDFHRNALIGQEGWAEAVPEDELILNCGRTWRLGPKPEYLSIWKCHGLGRLDEWTSTFAEGGADQFQNPFSSVATIDVAGWYHELVEPVRARGGIYYLELLDTSPGAADPEWSAVLTDWFQQRGGGSPSVQPLVLAVRAGLLAPEPGGIAVWRIPSYSELNRFSDVDSHAVTAGVYTDVGSETL